VTVDFEKAAPSASTQDAGSVKLVETVNILGGKHGIGRVDRSKQAGRHEIAGVYESPGGHDLVCGARELESLVLTAIRCTQMVLR